MITGEPRIKSAMTPFPHSIGLQEPIGVARRLMLEHHVHHLPVTDNRKLCGIISDRDIKLLLGPELGSPDPKELTVEDAYVEGGYSVDMETPLSIVVRAMADQHIGAAIVTGHERIAGIFTATDACRVLAEYLEERYHPPPDIA